MANATTGKLQEMADREVTVGGIVVALRLIKTKKGDRMASFILEDLEGGAEVLVFPETYKKVASPPGRRRRSCSSRAARRRWTKASRASSPPTWCPWTRPGWRRRAS